MTLSTILKTPCQVGAGVSTVLQEKICSRSQGKFLPNTTPPHGHQHRCWALADDQLSRIFSLGTLDTGLHPFHARSFPVVTVTHVLRPNVPRDRMSPG